MSFLLKKETSERKRDRRAQLKIQEMSFMLVAVVILFVLAGLFFVTIKYRELNRIADEAEKEKAISTVGNIANTAEFSCGSSESGCVDTDKLIVMQERQTYKGFWPVAYLAVRKIYPLNDSELEIECTKNNYPNCNIFEIYKETAGSVETISTFVSLCRQERDTETGLMYKKCELGKILAGFEPGK